jgi:hypothetical protein
MAIKNPIMEANAVFAIALYGFFDNDIYCCWKINYELDI